MAIILALGAASPARAGTLLDTSFEAIEGFSTGALVWDYRTAANPGQGGWYGEWYNKETVDTNDAVVSTEQAHSGTYSVRIPRETYAQPNPGHSVYNVYDFYHYDFPKKTTGKLTAEWWYYLDNIKKSGGSNGGDTNNVFGVIHDRDVGIAADQFATPFAEYCNGYNLPNRYMYATGTNWHASFDRENISAPGQWTGIKVVWDLDAPNLIFDLFSKFDGDADWTQHLDDKPKYVGTPDTLSTFTFYQLSGPLPYPGISFNHPDYSAFIDDIRITWEGDLPYDFDLDGDLDPDDIDILLANLSGAGNPAPDAKYDIDLDNDSDQDDITAFLQEAGKDYGDWNFDGSVDLADFNLWLGSDGNGGWDGGDGNGDAFNDLADFNMWLGESPPAAPQALLSPEPATLVLFGAAVALLRRRQGR